MDGRCNRCGAPGSPSGQAASCAACQLPPPPAITGAAAWLPTARRVTVAGDLGAILRGYRRASALTQQQLADMLGYDRTYISMIESGRRHVTGRGTLAIQPHVLGIAGPDDADFAAMLAFGTSVIRLAQVARRSGRATGRTAQAADLAGHC